MATSNIIMAWSKCKVEYVEENSAGTLPTTGWAEFGTIKDQSTTLESEEGDELEAKATGGQRVGYEQLEGGFTLTTTIIEPTNALFTALGLGTADTTTTTSENVTTHVPGKYYAIRITPKNKGAIGVAAPHCFVSVAPRYGEDTGNEMTLTISILHGAGDFWYQRFVTESALN